MKLDIYEDKWRYLRGTIALLLSLLAVKVIQIVLYHAGLEGWMVDIFYPSMCGFWIGLFIDKLVNIPTRLKNILRIIVFIGLVVAYYFIPAVGGLWDVSQGYGVALEYFSIFIGLGWCCGYVEEEKDRMMEWMVGFGISFFLLAFLSYVSNYIEYADSIIKFLSRQFDWSDTKWEDPYNIMSFAERLANRAIVVAIVPAVYFFYKLVMSHWLQNFWLGNVSVKKYLKLFLIAVVAVVSTGAINYSLLYEVDKSCKIVDSFLGIERQDYRILKRSTNQFTLAYTHPSYAQSIKFRGKAWQKIEDYISTFPEYFPEQDDEILKEYNPQIKKGYISTYDGNPKIEYITQSSIDNRTIAKIGQYYEIRFDYAEMDSPVIIIIDTEKQIAYRKTNCLSWN